MVREPAGGAEPHALVQQPRPAERSPRCPGELLQQPELQWPQMDQPAPTRSARASRSSSTPCPRPAGSGVATRVRSSWMATRAAISAVPSSCGRASSKPASRAARRRSGHRPPDRRARPGCPAAHGAAGRPGSRGVVRRRHDHHHDPRAQAPEHLSRPPGPGSTLRTDARRAAERTARPPPRRPRAGRRGLRRRLDRTSIVAGGHARDPAHAASTAHCRSVNGV